ncbi:SMC2 [Mytilus edulis]|uniref:SMC2 n=1 Tax=Mytilus edulis TaxID=6550 RepID=A0A8S3QDT2_MYTED|nr:SMC2 [Mytilus edulis]
MRAMNMSGKADEQFQKKNDALKKAWEQVNKVRKLWGFEKALSLILAMLLFKPAPLYILDEVDAALDISHTQNIGQMIKSHFKHSQFIVVSLKDGMFNNANVLYKTRFVDGVSTVTRYVQHHKSTSSSANKENDSTTAKKKQSAKRARVEEIAT